jgi:hypothetical protein
MLLSKCCNAPAVEEDEYKYGQLSTFYSCSDCNAICETYEAEPTHEKTIKENVDNGK